MKRSICFSFIFLNFSFGSSNAGISPRYCSNTQHVRLAVGPDPATEMIVSFASLPGFSPAPIGGVLVGDSPKTLHQEVHMESEPASSYQMPVDHHKGNAQNGDVYYSMHYHHITVSGLEPDTTYYYQPIFHSHLRAFASYEIVHADPQEAIKDEVKLAFEESELISEEDLHRRELGLAAYNGSEKQCPAAEKVRSFKTGPAPVTPGDPVRKVTFAVMGDIGQYPHSEETLLRMMRSRDEIDSIILAGDLAYPRLDQRQWDTFLDFLDDYPVAEYLPMQIVPGNHDIDKQEDGDDIFLGYEHRFRMPRVKPAELGRFAGPPGQLNMDAPPYPLPYEWGNAYYAYTYGPARFIMISAYSSMEPNSTQYNWIMQELKAVDRKVTPWLLVVLHTPLYNTFGVHHHDPQIFAAKEHLEPLFVQYGANLVFTGHIHAYLRTDYVVNGELNPKGPMHITVGAGGRKCEAPFQNVEPEPWVQVRDATYFGYGMLRIENETHAQWDWIHTGHADDHSSNQLYHSNRTLPQGPSLDRVIIYNQHFR